MTDGGLARLFVQGFVPALTVTALGVQFFVRYGSRVNSWLADLEQDIKRKIRVQFIEPLKDRRPGIRTVDEVDLPLKYIRSWGLYVYRRQYYKLAVWKAFLFSVLGGLCWISAYLLGHLFAPSATVSATGLNATVTLGVATVRSALRTAGLVSGLLFAFFAFVVVLKFEFTDDETSVPHPKD